MAIIIIIKCIYKQSRRCGRSSPHESTYGLLYFIKHNNDMHPPATLQKL